MQVGNFTCQIAESVFGSPPEVEIKKVRIEVKQDTGQANPAAPVRRSRWGHVAWQKSIARVAG